MRSNDLGKRAQAVAEVPGIVFLIGGRDHFAAAVHPNEINQFEGRRPWRLGFSNGPALRDEALRGGMKTTRTSELAGGASTAVPSMAGRLQYSSAMEDQSLVA
jgi:fructose-bisphosphate aldolase class 1